MRSAPRKLTPARPLSCPNTLSRCASASSSTWSPDTCPAYGRQKAVRPFGVPRPVGPSQPAPAVHQTLVLQVPLLPVVTSCSPDACAQV